MLKLFKCLFGDITVSRENLDRFTVLEETDYEGMKKKYCELVKGADGNYFLKPIIGSDSNTSNNIELPSTEGWPASAESEDEYWELLNGYNGGVLTRDSSKVSNLLNDIALNIPNSKVYIDIKKGLKLCVPDQVILDILRTDEICINDEVIYTNASPNADLDSILSDEMRAKLLFEKCMSNLENNFELTKNALKLLTQASMSHLGVLINWRFININLLLGIRCHRQASKIELKGSTVSITYNTIWEIVALDGREVDPHYMKACVKISILKKDLEVGSAGNAEMVETCSSFFKSLEDLESNESLPSEVDSMDLYLKKIEKYTDCFYPIDFYPGDFKTQQDHRRGLPMKLNQTSLNFVLYIMTLNKELMNSIFSIINVELPRYIESEAKRIFENKKLSYIPLYLEKELDLSINPIDLNFNILIKTFWKIFPLGRVMSIAVELKGKLLESFGGEEHKEKEVDEFRVLVKSTHRHLTGKKVQFKPNIDEFIIENATQYFYLLEENESNSWIKV